MDRLTATQRGGGSRKRTLRRATQAGAVIASLLAGASSIAQDKAPAQPKAEAKSNEPTPDSHAVTEGDTLWDLSGKYMGSPYEWPRLWSYNPEITNPHWIYPGHVLRLREGAQGGYTTAVPGQGAEGEGEQGGTGGLMSQRFGRGFGTATQMPQGTVVLGEEVYLDRDALTRAARIVGSSEDHMMLSPSDEVYLKFGKGDAPEQGKELTVFMRMKRSEVSPLAGRAGVEVHYAGSDGEVVRVLGALRVKSYDDRSRIARAVITEALEPIERGFEVTDVPRRLTTVAPKTNSRRVESKIVAATRPLGTLAQNQLVFIGVGSKQGVEIGNRFAVLREGDTWRRQLTLREDLTGADRPERHRPSDKNYPAEVVAEARVVYVRPESCTALITGSLEEVAPGDKVEMREGY